MFVIEKPPTEQLDYFVNLPEIHKATGYPPGMAVTFQKLYQIHERNMAFACDFGAMVFEYLGDDKFNSHFYFIPGSPGWEVKSYALLMLQEMFTIYGASVIVGYPPRGNLAVRVIGNALGYRKVKTKPTMDVLGRICDTYEVKAPWVLQQH